MLYDSFVKPPSKVTDYRTEFSGVRKEDLEGDHAVSLREVVLDVISHRRRRIRW